MARLRVVVDLSWPYNVERRNFVGFVTMVCFVSDVEWVLWALMPNAVDVVVVAVQERSEEFWRMVLSCLPP